MAKWLKGVEGSSCQNQTESRSQHFNLENEKGWEKLIDVTVSMSLLRSLIVTSANPSGWDSSCIRSILTKHLSQTLPVTKPLLSLIEHVLRAAIVVNKVLA